MSTSRITIDEIVNMTEMVMPAITSEERDSYVPETGMFAYIIDNNRFEVYNGSAWVRA